MKRLDEGKVSLVEFLASIRYRQRGHHGRKNPAEPSQFAQFSPLTRNNETTSTEERLLVRSVN
ncbi:hypothetical protein [Candidatus Marimicrobium litorale]|jgi:hypothetical protein|uniref:Transposase n=1 Tax=Candidatus Marimicrobium litorale TaxID=2518991 RepID=A0ABT3T5S7_9GAMM|nr:hypothetical protein [Candidatus Marimicrobium litorale]MCX2977636.1 hypothetical protein [Candidatus Marimicrobium litorale]